MWRGQRTTCRGSVLSFHPVDPGDYTWVISLVQELHHFTHSIHVVHRVLCLESVFVFIPLILFVYFTCSWLEFAPSSHLGAGPCGLESDCMKMAFVSGKWARSFVFVMGRCSLFFFFFGGRWVSGEKDCSWILGHRLELSQDKGAFLEWVSTWLSLPRGLGCLLPSDSWWLSFLNWRKGI